MTKEILSRLDLIAAKLGHTAAELWPHAVRHTAIQSMSEIFIWAGVALLAIALISTGLWAGSKKKFEDGPWVAITMAGSVLVLLFIITVAMEGSGAIAGALEPTGHTVKTILKSR